MTELLEEILPSIYNDTLKEKIENQLTLLNKSYKLLTIFNSILRYIQ